MGTIQGGQINAACNQYYVVITKLKLKQSCKNMLYNHVKKSYMLYDGT